MQYSVVALQYEVIVPLYEAVSTLTNQYWLYIHFKCLFCCVQFLASSQRDCTRVQEELCSLRRDNEDMRREVREVLSALEELALNYDRKSQEASNSTHTNHTLGSQLAVKNVSTWATLYTHSIHLLTAEENVKQGYMDTLLPLTGQSVCVRQEMLEATRSELVELQELNASQKRRTVDVLHVLLRDLSDMGAIICVHEIKMVNKHIQFRHAQNICLSSDHFSPSLSLLLSVLQVCEDGVSLDDEFSAVQLFLTKLKSELKSLIIHTKQLESTHEHTSFKILASDGELASCHLLISQVRWQTFQSQALSSV